MTFHLDWTPQANTLGIDAPIAILHDANNRLEVWPALGLNAFRWAVAGQELIYRNPQFFTENRPTRGGIPILFPFPNRIRAGQFSWAGKSYQLPLTDPAKKNAIHGFACKRAWRVLDQGADSASAWLMGEFQGSVDAPESLAEWPADYRLRVTYRLFDHVLRVEAEVDNPDTKPLPFGLGYHPYFALEAFGGSQAQITVAAEKRWELTENLPTGQILDVDEARDLRHGKTYADLHVDDVLTGLQAIAFDQQDQLNLVGVVQPPSGERLLSLWTSPDFRDLVLFTPPHREAICLEPYTCTTDAIHLSQQGIDAGWRVLQPGGRWHGVVEIHFSS